jgi:hypothetical protein
MLMPKWQNAEREVAALLKLVTNSKAISPPQEPGARPRVFKWRSRSMPLAGEI